MAYKDSNGNKKYTLKEKIAYHNKCANSGKKDGKTLTFTEKVNHARAAARCRKKLGDFVKTAKFVNNK